jgi:hypothetical protein
MDDENSPVDPFVVRLVSAISKRVGATTFSTVSRAHLRRASPTGPGLDSRRCARTSTESVAERGVLRHDDEGWRGRLAAASSDGRPIVVEASLVAPVGGGLDRRGLPSW